MADRLFPVPEFASTLPLPSGWEEKRNEQGRKYFVDYQHKTTTFHDPRLCPLPRGWEMKWDNRKNKVYFSDYHTKTTTYTDPRQVLGYSYDSPTPSYANCNPPSSIPAYAQASQAQTSYAQPNPRPQQQMNPNLAQYTAQPPSVSIVINGKQLSESEIQILRQSGSPCIPGSYWYDGKCGAFGYQGGPCLFWWVPGLQIGGPLQANASNGTTGVFINGRQLCAIDVMNWNTYVGPVST